MLGRTLRNRHLFLLDAALLTLAPFVAYAVRFEGWTWHPEHVRGAVMFTIVATPVRLLMLYLMGMYRRLWRYASIGELEVIFAAAVATSVASFLIGAFGLTLLHLSELRVPISALLLDAFFATAIISLPRLRARQMGWRSRRVRSRGGRRVLVAGAGDAGQVIAREMLRNVDLAMNPVGFIDDDPMKIGHEVVSVPVLGTLADAPDVIRREGVEELVIAMPGATGAVIRQLVRAALDTGIRTRTVPALGEIIAGKVKLTALREVEIQDLLRREPVQTNLADVRRLATGKVVLVTGAGGSIGSELSRQLASLEPARLLVLGHGENSIFEILQELRATHPDVPIVPIIADVRDRERMRQTMQHHRPFAVFHAAAHKHVPLMEENVAEAVTNNVMGTRNVVEEAGAAGVTHFAMISSDKAVRSSNVMGATKRIAELVVRSAALSYGRNFVTVRFGNVLGSRGSVVPTFVRQIRAGGPVTVTHPEMRRYFMLIPEAVQLVLQAGALGRGGELFMLDMGDPVRIVDLAQDLIRLSGFELGVDIDIKYSGVRRGEKLFEEMFQPGERVSPTNHPKVLCIQADPLDDVVRHRIERLIAMGAQGKSEYELREQLRLIVPDYNSAPQGSQAESLSLDLASYESSASLTTVPSSMT